MESKCKCSILLINLFILAKKEIVDDVMTDALSGEESLNSPTSSPQNKRSHLKPKTSHLNSEKILNENNSEVANPTIINREKNNLKNNTNENKTNENDSSSKINDKTNENDSSKKMNSTNEKTLKEKSHSELEASVIEALSNDIGTRDKSNSTQQKDKIPNSKLSKDDKITSIKYDLSENMNYLIGKFRTKNLNFYTYFFGGDLNCIFPSFFLKKKENFPMKMECTSDSNLQQFNEKYDVEFYGFTENPDISNFVFARKDFIFKLIEKTNSKSKSKIIKYDDLANLISDLTNSRLKPDQNVMFLFKFEFKREFYEARKILTAISEGFNILKDNINNLKLRYKEKKRLFSEVEIISNQSTIDDKDNSDNESKKKKKEKRKSRDSKDSRDSKESKQSKESKREKVKHYSRKKANPEIILSESSDSDQEEGEDEEYNSENDNDNNVEDNSEQEEEKKRKRGPGRPRKNSNSDDESSHKKSKKIKQRKNVKKSKDESEKPKSIQNTSKTMTNTQNIQSKTKNVIPQTQQIQAISQPMKQNQIIYQQPNYQYQNYLSNQRANISPINLPQSQNTKLINSPDIYHVVVINNNGQTEHTYDITPSQHNLFAMLVDNYKKINIEPNVPAWNYLIQAIAEYSKKKNLTITETLVSTGKLLKL
jgi:hypothetical protein